MPISKTILSLSILGALTHHAYAVDAPVQELATIKTTAHPLVQSAVDYAAADHVLKRDELRQGAASIGDALASQVGVYNSQFGGAASRPVIRGQDASRIKVLQNASETLDVSTLSPDHAVTVDPLLAQQVEIVQGPSTLIYGAGNVGGLVNVTDTRVPSALPDKDATGSIGYRYNSGNDETATVGSATVAIADQFALHVEGLKRNTNDYIVPSYAPKGEKSRRVDNSFADSELGTVGLSWINDLGFVGLAYTHRKDNYGLPGDDSAYEDCDVVAGALACPPVDPNAPPSAGSVIDLKSDRYDLRSELNQPFQGVEKIRAQASYTNYAHAEVEDGVVGTQFKNKGYDGRLEVVHSPFDDWEGVIGAQLGQQKLDITGEEALFAAPVTTRTYSLFALEHKQFGDVHVELSGRAEHQDSNIDTAQKDYQDTAFSVAGAANWEFVPRYTLSLVGSHQERNPLAQELYANGKHLATNSFEIGNPDLNKERSNNLELGLHYLGDKLDYHVHVYHNWFDNYIYAKTLDQFDRFRLVQYSQDSARFVGAEAEIGYQLSPMYKASLLGDYVRAKIDNEGNAPRIPGGRLGTKVDAAFGDGFSGLAEYYHVFTQNQIADFEDKTPGYNMVNLGLSYRNSFAKATDYTLYVKANNLLDDVIYQHASFSADIPQMGRNFTVGVDFKY